MKKYILITLFIIPIIDTLSSQSFEYAIDSSFIAKISTVDYISSDNSWAITTHEALGINQSQANGNLLKLDSLGNLLWSMPLYSFSGLGGASIQDVHVLDNGQIMVILFDICGNTCIHLFSTSGTLLHQIPIPNGSFSGIQIIDTQTIMLISQQYRTVYDINGIELFRIKYRSGFASHMSFDMTSSNHLLHFRDNIIYKVNPTTGQTLDSVITNHNYSFLYSLDSNWSYLYDENQNIVLLDTALNIQSSNYSLSGDLDQMLMTKSIHDNKFAVLGYKNNVTKMIFLDSLFNIVDTLPIQSAYQFILDFDSNEDEIMIGGMNFTAPVSSWYILIGDYYEAYHTKPFIKSYDFDMNTIENHKDIELSYPIISHSISNFFSHCYQDANRIYYNIQAVVKNTGTAPIYGFSIYHENSYIDLCFLNIPMYYNSNYWNFPSINLQPGDSAIVPLGDRYVYNGGSLEPLRLIAQLNEPYVDEDLSNNQFNFDWLTSSLTKVAQKEAVKLFPNPVKDQLTLQFLHTPQFIDFYMTNSLGQIVKNETRQFFGNTTTINLKNLENGAYFIYGVTDKGKHFTQRFIKY